MSLSTADIKGHASSTADHDPIIQDLIKEGDSRIANPNGAMHEHGTMVRIDVADTQSTREGFEKFSIVVAYKVPDIHGIRDSLQGGNVYGGVNSLRFGPLYFALSKKEKGAMLLRQRQVQAMLIKQATFLLTTRTDNQKYVESQKWTFDDCNVMQSQSGRHCIGFRLEYQKVSFQDIVFDAEKGTKKGNVAWSYDATKGKVGTGAAAGG
jgi:hypothetical protein